MPWSFRRASRADVRGRPRHDREGGRGRSPFSPALEISAHSAHGWPSAQSAQTKGPASARTGSPAHRSANIHPTAALMFGRRPPMAWTLTGTGHRVKHQDAMPTPCAGGVTRGLPQRGARLRSLGRGPSGRPQYQPCPPGEPHQHDHSRAPGWHVEPDRRMPPLSGEPSRGQLPHHVGGDQHHPEKRSADPHQRPLARGRQLAAAVPVRRQSWSTRPRQTTASPIPPPSRHWSEAERPWIKQGCVRLGWRAVGSSAVRFPRGQGATSRTTLR
jgi:hypothetical protein